MTDEIDAGTSAPAGDVQGQQAAPTPTPQGGGGHPAWNDLRSAIGDTTFKLIEPHLSKYDTAANERITSLNGKLDQYTGLGDFEYLQQARGLAQAIDNDPAAFYTQYGEYLRSNGYDIDGGQQPSPDGDPGDEGDGEEGDPRLARLEQTNQELLERFESQQFEQEVAQQSEQLQAQFDSLREQNPWMGDADFDQISQRAQTLITLGTGGDDPVGTAATELIEFRNRILTAPRPNDSAPKLIPTGGGNPAAGQQPNVGSMNAAERQAFVASMVGGIR